MNKNSQSPLPPADEMDRQAESRSNCYGLLALVFRDAPTSEVVRQFRSPPLAEALSCFGYDVASDLAGELEAVTERLREEYTRTFASPGAPALPYGSMHDEKEGRLWGDSTVRVKRFIEATGLSFEHDWDSIPDHIAIELELMQRLTAYEAKLWGQRTTAPAHGKENVDDQLGRCLEVEEEFLRDHLCRWLPQFCDRVSENSAALFYGEMARLAKSFVLSDIVWTEDVRSALLSGSVTEPQQRGKVCLHEAQ